MFDTIDCLGDEHSKTANIIVSSVLCMDRIQIYLCVCVCVCVPHTFCQLAYRAAVIG